MVRRKVCGSVRTEPRLDPVEELVAAALADVEQRDASLRAEACDAVPAARSRAGARRTDSRNPWDLLRDDLGLHSQARAEHCRVASGLATCHDHDDVLGAAPLGDRAVVGGGVHERRGLAPAQLAAPAGAPPRTSPRAVAACSIRLRRTAVRARGRSRTATSRPAATSSDSTSRPLPPQHPGELLGRCAAVIGDRQRRVAADHRHDRCRRTRSRARRDSGSHGLTSSSSAMQKPILPGWPSVARSSRPGKPPPVRLISSRSARPIVRFARRPGPSAPIELLRPSESSRRAVEDHQLSRRLRGDGLAVEVEGRLERRLHGRDDDREVLGPAAGEHRARRDPLERRLAHRRTAPRRARARDRGRRASRRRGRGSAGSPAARRSSRARTCPRARRAARRRRAPPASQRHTCSWPRTPACARAARRSPAQPALRPEPMPARAGHRALRGPSRRHARNRLPSGSNSNVVGTLCELATSATAHTAPAR